MLKIAEKEGDGRAMSIIVSDGNPNARRLYERVGYVAERDQKMVKEDWKGEGKNWILMIKA